MFVTTEICENFKGKADVRDNIAWFLKKTDDKGNTILHYVAETNNVDFAENLIAAGCYVNQKNKDEESPLVHAIRAGKLDMVKALMNAGAIDMKVPSENEGGSLHIATRYGWPDIVQFLVTAGADVNATDLFQMIPLHVTMEKVPHKNEDSCSKIIQILIDAGSDLSEKNSIFPHDTPLYLIFSQGHLKGFKLMLSMRPELRQQINFNYLDQAAKMGSIHALKYLINDIGLDIDMRDEDGSTCLYSAVEFGSSEIVEFLLKNKATINFINNKGFDPLSAGLEFWSYRWFQPPEGNNLSPKSIKNMKCLELLLDYGYEVNNGMGDNAPLYMFLKNRGLHSDFLRVLLKNGANFDFANDIVKNVLNDTNASRYQQILLRHTAIFQAQDRNDGPANFDLNKLNEDLKKYYASCRDELELIKTTRIDDTNVTFFNVLVNRDIGPYTRNECIKNTFKSRNISKEFPIYGDLMRERFSEEIENQKLVASATEGLSYLLNWDENTSHLIFSNILRYLNKRDLDLLSEI